MLEAVQAVHMWLIRWELHSDGSVGGVRRHILGLSGTSVMYYVLVSCVSTVMRGVMLVLLSQEGLMGGAFGET